MKSIAEQLSEFYCQLKFQDLPSDKIQDIKRLIFDYLGVATRGSMSLAGRIGIEFALDQHSMDSATIIGSPKRCTPMLAAFANAISNHSIEMDDVDHLALFHFGPPVVSAGLAMAEKADANGAELLTAVYVGCELMARLSNVMNPSLRNRGFHTTPVCGVFGAALTAGRLLALSPEAITNAMGLAGAMSAGLMEMYGPSLQKRFNPGPAAQNGIIAAQLAKRGFTGTHMIFEGERGLFQAFSDDFDPSAATRNLGREFPVEIEFKRYASARPIHNAVDCALNLKRQNRIDPSSVEKITIFRHPDWAHYHRVYSPSNINEAQVSLPYSVAVALTEGDAFLEQYRDELIHDAGIQALMGKIHVEAKSDLPCGVSCLMEVKTQEGRVFTNQVDQPKGSIQNPMTQQEFIEKFKKLSAVLFKEAEIDQIADVVLDLENQPSVKAVMANFCRDCNHP